MKKPLPASRVASPLLAECYANLECRVADARMVLLLALATLVIRYGSARFPSGQSDARG